LLIRASPGQGGAARSNAIAAGDLGAVLDRAALIGNRLAGRLDRRVERGECRLVELVADQRLGSMFAEDGRRRDRADHDARVGAGSAGVKRDVDAAADNRDVHLGARDKAQIGVALMRLWLRHAEFDDKLALLQRSTARTGADRLGRRLALAVGAGDDADRARGDHRRHAVGRRRGVAQIAGERAASLDLRRADQVGALDDARPGMFECMVAAQHHARRRRADDEEVAFLANADDAGDALGVDDDFWLQPAAAQLHQQIGPSGHDLRQAAGGRQHLDRFIDTRRRRIIDPGHVRSSKSTRAPAAVASGELSWLTLPEPGA
jgi:hypothetical protein